MSRQLATQVVLGKDQYNSITKMRVALEKKMRDQLNQNPNQEHPKQQQIKSLEGNKVSIYRVPEKLRYASKQVYLPHFVSIGPYHHGSNTLQEAEKLKLQCLKRLVESNRGDSSILDKLLIELHEIEHEARESYTEEISLNKDDFVKMLLLDGCFIVRLFKELEKNNFKVSPSLLSKRWMLPVVRHDLIILENQLPMIVLKRLFDEISSTLQDEDQQAGSSSLEALAVRFFDPLMPRSEEILGKRVKSTESTSYMHLLDLFHSSICLENRKQQNASICPANLKVKRNEKRRRYYSASELKKAGIGFHVEQDSEPLELKFKRGELKMPCLQIDDHTDSFFRNMVAYEQCHPTCQTDITTYLFFLVKLINTAQDVEILHFEGVIQHALGSNQQVADLVNNLCKEVEHDGHGSHLACQVVEDINCYSSKWWVKTRAKLRHEYFSDLWAALKTIAAVLLVYLAFLQASCNVIASRPYKTNSENDNEITGGWATFHSILVNPIGKLRSFLQGKDAIDLFPVDFGEGLKDCNMH